MLHQCTTHSCGASRGEHPRNRVSCLHKHEGQGCHRWLATVLFSNGLEEGRSGGRTGQNASADQITIAITCYYK